jgi:hypothetical protein
VVKPQFLQITPDLKGTNIIAQGEALCGKSVRKIPLAPLKGGISEQLIAILV